MNPLPPAFPFAFATPSQQRQIKFETLPKWVQREYHTDGTIHAVVSRWLYSETLSPEEFLEKLAEIEHKRAEYWQSIALELCRLHGSPSPEFVASITPK